MPGTAQKYSDLMRENLAALVAERVQRFQLRVVDFGAVVAEQRLKTGQKSN